MSMTDLDTLAVGSTVGSLNKDTHGAPATWGMVVDFGMHDDGAPFVVLLTEVPGREVRVQVYYKGASKPKEPHVARLHQLDLSALDPATVEPPNVSRMLGWGKKALYGECVLPGERFALAYTAARLFEAAEELGAQGKADVVTAHLEADRGEVA